jgi:hypothetical protein
MCGMMCGVSFGGCAIHIPKLNGALGKCAVQIPNAFGLHVGLLFSSIKDY